MKFKIELSADVGVSPEELAKAIEDRLATIPLPDGDTFFPYNVFVQILEER